MIKRNITKYGLAVALLWLAAHAQLAIAAEDNWNSVASQARDAWRSGDTSKSIKLTQKALALAAWDLGDPHPVVATLENMLGWFYLQAGDLFAAEKILFSAVSMRKSMEGIDPADISQSMANLNAVYQAMAQKIDIDLEPPMDSMLAQVVWGYSEIIYSDKYPLQKAVIMDDQNRIVELLDGKKPKQDLLTRAIELGYSETAAILIDAGALPDGEILLGMRPLHVAAMYGRFEIAKLLLNIHGVSAGPTMNNGQTALHLASARGDEKLARLLLENGADPNGQNDRGNTPLILVNHNKTDVYAVIQELAKNYQGTQVARLVSDFPAFKYGADPNGAGVSELLLEYGADVNWQDSLGWTALNHAAQDNNARVAQLLIGYGARINVVDNQSFTPLHTAAEAGSTDVVRVLLNSGAKIDKTGHRNRTALMEASYGGHFSTIKLLIDRSAHTQAKDMDGNTALHLASSKGHLSAVKELIASDIDINSRNKAGQTPLLTLISGDKTRIHWNSRKPVSPPTGFVNESKPPAVERMVETAKTLIANGANVNARDYANRYPLNWASDSGSTQLVPVLIEAGANISQKGDYGSTPLHRAANAGHVEIAKFLIEAGANPNALDDQFSTPLSLAVARQYGDLVELLKPVTKNWQFEREMSLAVVALQAGDLEAIREHCKKARETLDKNEKSDYRHSLVPICEAWAFGLKGEQKKRQQLLLYAAELGNPIAQNNLGSMYQSGLGIKKDYLLAFKWYKLSADQGYHIAMKNIGWMYAQGLGTSQDYLSAAKYYLKAAMKGNATAANNLAYLYSIGQGLRKDYDESFRLYHLSATKGEVNGVYGLGHMYENGYGTEPDPIMAYAMYSLSESLQNPNPNNMAPMRNLESQLSKSEINRAIQLGKSWKLRHGF